MTYQKGDKFYEGKAKSVYAVVGHPELLWLDFKDSLTAFNAQKLGSFEGKGAVNFEISDLVYDHLEGQGLKTHRVAKAGPRSLIVRRLSMIPLEVVVRNRMAGSSAKKFGWEEGRALARPLVEFYFKSDQLGDPFVSDEQALLLGAARDQAELEVLKGLGLKVNTHLKSLFLAVGLELIDFKLEFGKSDQGEILLGDEISPDSCRLWDMKTGERMDKDRFRRDLGRVEESYREVLKRLKALAPLTNFTTQT